MKTLLLQELKSWWLTKKAYINIIIWTIVANFMLLFLIFAGKSIPQEELVVDLAAKAQIAIGPITMFSIIGVIIITQESLISEILSGTTEWILSKPISRINYIFSKLLGSIANTSITIIIIPFIISVFIISISENLMINLTNILISIIMLLIYTIFYISLTTFLVIFTKNRITTLGIALGILFSQQILVNFIPDLIYISPMALSMNAIASLIGNNINSLTLQPVFLIILFTMIFIVGSVIKFKKNDF